jgi:hypothetical protein
VAGFFYKRRTKESVFFILVLIFISCKTDEFKLSELKVKEDFRTDLITPILSGNLEFRDFIPWEDYEYSPVANTDAFLKFSDDRAVKIPSTIVFSPYVLIKDFPFSIQGNYELSTINLKFRVKNGTPFPFNMKWRFYDKATPSKLGPVIQPENSFQQGEIDGTSIKPFETEQELLLTEEQRLSFMNGNRIHITTWFDKTDFITYNDTLDAHYPVDISVIMAGEVKAGNENN